MAAAKRATDAFSHADAARLYRRAIEAGRAVGVSADARSLAEAWEQLGEALRYVGEPAAATNALTEARRLVPDDPIAQARLCERHADIADGSGATTSAVRWLLRGFRCVETDERPEAIAWRARIRSLLGGVRNKQGRWADAIATCRQAISEAESIGELSALAHACYALDWALVESGRADQATNSWRALAIYEQLGDPEHEFLVLNNMGGMAYWADRWDDAVQLYQRAAECAQRAGKPSSAAFTDCNVGEILSDQGNLDEAEVQLQRARQIWSATGERQAVTWVNLLIGRLAVRRGKYSDGLSMLEAAGSELRQLGLDAYTDVAQAWIAEAAAFGGDPFRALEVASQELQANDRQRPLLTRVGGVALARLGQTQAAMRELRHSLQTARDRNARYDIAATIDAMAAIETVEPDLLRERDEILHQLKITELPAVNASQSV
jgi:tetratricopeptide (TPR) repeat protein